MTNSVENILNGVDKWQETNGKTNLKYFGVDCYPRISEIVPSWHGKKYQEYVEGNRKNGRAIVNKFTSFNGKEYIISIAHMRVKIFGDVAEVFFQMHLIRKKWYRVSVQKIMYNVGYEKHNGKWRMFEEVKDVGKATEKKRLDVSTSDEQMKIINASFSLSENVLLKELSKKE